MAARNRIPQHALKVPPRGVPPLREEPPFMRGPVPLPPHPALLEEMRGMPFGRGPGPLPPPHPAILEEKMAAQHEEIQALLVENQGLAATHVALREELARAQQELQRLNHVAAAMHAEKDHQLRELFEKSVKLDTELRAVEPMKAELIQLRAENQKIAALRQDLTAQVQAMTQDLTRARGDLQQTGALRNEMDTLHHELQRARAAVEYEKKAHAEQIEQSQTMEKNLISMAREVEKLRAELANVEKRSKTAANPAGAYGGGYGSADGPYPTSAYGDGYGMHPPQRGAEGAAQYGPSGASWAPYDIQQPHVRR